MMMNEDCIFNFHGKVHFACPERASLQSVNQVHVPLMGFSCLLFSHLIVSRRCAVNKFTVPFIIYV